MTSAGQRLADEGIASDRNRAAIVTGEPDLVEDRHRALRRQ
jgi:hypothetical protein